MDDNTLNRLVLNKAFIWGDEALTTVEYKALGTKLSGLGWIAEGQKIVVRVWCVPGGGDMVALFVEHTTPAVTPTATSVAANGTMIPIAVGSFQDFEVDELNSVLAWGSISGTAKGRIARMSP